MEQTASRTTGASRETIPSIIEQKVNSPRLPPAKARPTLKPLGGLRVEDLETQWQRDEERYTQKMATLKRRMTTCTRIIEEYKAKGNQSAVEEKERQLGADKQDYLKLKKRLDGLKERLGQEGKSQPLRMQIRVLSPRQIEMKQRTEDILKLRPVEALKK
jgi:hypothetical protein